MYTCFRCGKKVDSDFLPDGWFIRYDGIVLCDDCEDALHGNDELVEFLKDLNEARLAIKSAIETLNKSSILVGRRRAIRDKLNDIILRLNEIESECRKPKPSEEG